jgi:hypothetical protein
MSFWEDEKENNFLLSADQVEGRSREMWEHKLKQVTPLFQILKFETFNILGPFLCFSISAKRASQLSPNLAMT